MKLKFYHTHFADMLKVKTLNVSQSFTMLLLEIYQYYFFAKTDIDIACQCCCRYLSHPHPLISPMLLDINLV